MQFSGPGLTLWEVRGRGAQRWLPPPPPCRRRSHFGGSGGCSPALRRFIPASLVSRLNPFLFISVATGIASFSVFILSRSLGDAFTYSCLPYQTLLPKLLLPPYQTLLL